MKAATRISLVASVCLLSVIATAPPIVGQSTTQAQPARFNAIYAFGDSLADNGNDLIATRAIGLNPAVPPSVSPHMAYYNGRFSNGPVAFEYLWQLISGRAPDTTGSLRPFLEPPFLRNGTSRAALDFAFGGSGTGFFEQSPGGFFVPGLRGQVELFRATLGGRPPSARALAAIFAGAGDYLRTPPLSPAQSVGNISAAIQRLYALGIRNVLVLNLPDLGIVPMFATSPQSAALSELVRAHNAALATAVAALQAQLIDLNLVAVDVNAVLQQVPPTMNVTVPALDALLGPTTTGLPMSTCLFVDPATCQDVPTFDVGLQYLFWDGEHPTTAVHQLLAAYLFDRLNAISPTATAGNSRPFWVGGRG